MRLTDLSVKRLKSPPKGQVTYTDDAVPGFGVRVSQGGVKSFVVVTGRDRRRTTIGRYPTITLQEARAKARELAAARTLGKEDIPALKFEDAIPIFLASRYPAQGIKQSTRIETERLLRRHFLPSLRHEILSQIQTHAIARVIDRLRKTPGEARHAFGAIRVLFRWAEGRRYVSRSPCAGLAVPKPNPPRDRVLTDDELVNVLTTVRTEASNYHKIIELLILTGQRRGEIAALRAEWIDFEKRTIALPPEITKNKRRHTIPFGAMAEAVLRKGQAKGLLFPGRGIDGPVYGWSKLKPKFDEKCPINHWTLHDLRRTCATNLAALGVPVHVTEKLLNHVSGTTGGIVAVYQRHAYLEEMRQAMDVWENRLRTLLERKNVWPAQTEDATGAAELQRPLWQPSAPTAEGFSSADPEIPQIEWRAVRPYRISANRGDE